MSALIKWGITLLLSSVLLIFAFSQFGFYLVDYSLENLNFVMEGVDKDFENENSLKFDIYKNMIDDLVLDQTIQEDIDAKNMVLLQATQSAVTEVGNSSGVEKAKLYLTSYNQEVSKEGQGLTSKLKRKAYQLILSVNQFTSSLIVYFKNRLAPEVERPFQISDQLLLDRAKQKVEQGELQEAKKLYETYLKTYRNKPDRGLVSLSLSHILISLHEWSEAEKRLKYVRSEFRNKEEGKIARSLLKKVFTLMERNKKIDEYLLELETVDEEESREGIYFKLGVNYLAIGKFVEAEKYFQLSSKNKEGDYYQKSLFYIGWAQKKMQNLDGAVKTLTTLLDDETVDEELRLALHSELATVHTNRGELGIAKEYYKKLSRQLESSGMGGISSESVGALQQVVMVERISLLVNSGDFRGAKVEAKEFDGLLGGSNRFVGLANQIQQTGRLDLKTVAFSNLLIGKYSDAIRLFKKQIILNSKDGWAYSGLATCYFMLRERSEAESYAIKGYQLKEDEYTASVLGFFYSALGEYDKAANLYRAAVAHNQKYIVARYNLAEAYLRTGKYNNAYVLLLNILDLFSNSANSVMRARIYNNIGVSLWGVKKMDEAMKAFKNALRMVPEFPEARENLRFVEQASDLESKNATENVAA